MGRLLGRKTRSKLSRLFKNTRGVSETVAILLTAVIVVAAGSTALAFGVGFLQQTSSAFTRDIQLDSAAIQERFTVINVWFKNPADQDVRVGIFNHGDAPIEIDTIFLNSTIFSNLQPTDSNFQPQEFRYIDLTLSQTPQPGEKFVVRVVTMGGTVHESRWKV